MFKRLGYIRPVARPFTRLGFRYSTEAEAPEVKIDDQITKMQEQLKQKEEEISQLKVSQ